MLKLNKKSLEVVMESLMKRFFRSSIISSIILIALGLLLIFQSEATIMMISYVIGGILIAIGVIAIIKFIQNVGKEQKNELDIVYGVVCIILGIIVIKNPEAIASIIPIILGISIILSSATKLQYAIELRANKNKLWKTTLILALISTLCGIILLFNPFKAASYFTKVVGIFIIIYAVLDIISSYTVKRNIKIFQKSIEEGITEAVIVSEEIESSKKKTKKNKK